MTTAAAEKSGRFTFSREIRLSEVIQIILVLVAIGGWAVRTEGKIEKVAADGRSNAESIREASENNRETARIIAEIREQLTNARIAIASYHGTGTLK